MEHCILCKTNQNIHIHEVFYGTSNRKKSIKYGCCVPLCSKHHNASNEAVHFNHELDLRLKKAMQKAFEKRYSHDEFMRVFKRNYLGGNNGKRSMD